ncbi:concanavalin A-like lectin/glucanase domain-containing protein [Lentinula detonsa]|uniref:Concanavalin A-like lectin/glucanase domain-containing protein n=1 Tax=Lentinula detonsa TaxID=2804962 RepID=A0AA38PPF1_9AGAR|nr:concanavalin A-like lectin/glucanase domain-containing protein [Lentinula detonsa]
MPAGLYLRRFSDEPASPVSPVSPPQSQDAHFINELEPPNAPFMAESGHVPNQGNSLYNGSVGASLASKGSTSELSRSRHNSFTFRAPFLSPASRPSSNVANNAWTPPTYSQTRPSSPTASSTALAFPHRAKQPFQSTLLLEKIPKEDKPWLAKPPSRHRVSYWLTLLGVFLGLAGAALLCFFELQSLNLLDESNLCTVFFDDFTSGSLDTSIWSRTVELGGFGNGEFEIMTNKDENLKIQNSQLYLIPTLTSDTIGNTSAIFDGYTYDLGDDCTTSNQTACSVTSDSSTKTVIPPVQSARISTNGTYSLKYGRVQVRAKTPTGDWLWPSIWMLPVNSTYGVWPLSGEIDIMEARGNSLNYPDQGANYVRSSLNYAPLASLLSQSSLYGWWFTKRLDSSSWSTGFHTYTLEWTDKWMRMYVDSRLQAMLDISIKSSKESFFNRAGYPTTAMNSSSGDTVAVENIYDEAGGGWNAPFDQEFYLIIQLAVGGTSGWFPDGDGGKMWTDGSTEAMYDFAEAQADWYGTWPTTEDDKALRVDWVKMWNMC